MRLRSRRKIEIERIHGVARRMMFRDIQRLEIVIRRLDFTAFHDGKTKRKKDSLDLFECLPYQVPRANRPNNAGQREVNALAGKGCAFRCGSYGLLKLFDYSLDVRTQTI